MNNNHGRRKEYINILMYEIYCLVVHQNSNLQNSDLVECITSEECPTDRPKCNTYGHCVLGKNLENLTHYGY